MFDLGWCATPQEGAHTVASFRAELANLGEDRERIARKVIAAYGSQLRELGPAPLNL